MDKAGIAIGAVVGGILFVIAMMGFMAITTYLGFYLIIAGLAALVVAGIARLLQVQVRLVSLFGVLATLFTLASLICMLAGHALPAILGCVGGGVLGIVYYLLCSSAYRRALADADKVTSYCDEDGKEHKCVRVGVPPALEDRPVLLTILMMAMFVAVLVVIGAMRYFIATNEFLGADTWAAIFAAIAGASIGGLYTVVNLESKEEVEVFYQAIPDAAACAMCGWLEEICPGPFKVLSEALSGLCDAWKHVWAVSLRWN